MTVVSSLGLLVRTITNLHSQAVFGGLCFGKHFMGTGHVIPLADIPAVLGFGELLFSLLFVNCVRSFVYSLHRQSVRMVCLCFTTNRFLKTSAELKRFSRFHSLTVCALFALFHVR